MIAALAERQHGVVSRSQLLEAGIGRRAIGHRLEQNRLRIVHRGVYAVGHRHLTVYGRWMAAVAAAGGDAVLSHRAAAALWAIRRSDHLEVTSPRKPRRPGIVTHTSRLPDDEVTSLRAIPVTTLPRTLLDLSTVLAPHQVERAVNQAELRGLTDPLSLADLAARYPGRPRTRAIEAILDRLEAGTTVTRSELEAQFLAFVRLYRLPPGVPNAVVCGFECDVVWFKERVVVELDGRRFHGTSVAFHRDRARDRALQAAGWRVVRVTWWHLEREPDALAADLRRILRAPARPRSARARAAAP